MEDGRLPKDILYGEFYHAPRSPGRPKLCYKAGEDPGGAIALPKTYKSNFIYHNFIQLGKQNSRLKAILSSIILSQQCCGANYIFRTV